MLVLCRRSYRLKAAKKDDLILAASATAQQVPDVYTADPIFKWGVEDGTIKVVEFIPASQTVVEGTAEEITAPPLIEAPPAPDQGTDQTPAQPPALDQNPAPPAPDAQAGAKVVNAKPSFQKGNR